ncbi:MAG TPA: ABC transporter ATP-binding protein [Chloroflexota bacterium]|nr:ABC transporter ATP-binding protein [Chloroflexota bacterium]
MFRGPLHAHADLPEGRAADSQLVLRRLLALILPYRLALLTIPLLGVVVAAASALAPLLTGIAFDQFIARDDIAGLVRTVLLLVGVYTAGMLARAAQSYQMGWIAQRVLARLRSDIFAAIQRQSLRFFDHHESGDLQSRLVNDVDVINTLLGQGLVQAFAGLLGITGVLIGMFSLNWRLALASCLVIPLMFATTNTFSNLARQAFRRARETIGDVSANLQEDIAGVKVAQAFNRVEINRARFAERNRANRDANIGASAVTAAFFPAMDVLSTLAISIVVGYGGWMVIAGQASLGMIVAFLGYVQQFFWPIQQLGQLYTQAQSALAAAERIFELIDEPVDMLPPAHPVRLERVAGRIQFEDVEFAYEPDHPVLQGVSFVAEPGQTIALVGPTGAGKTTIVSLIARFYDVTAGRITLDGIDLRDLDPIDLRRQMGIIPQNSFLFSGSIRDNIRYGRLEATDAEIEHAARLARADDFIRRLPAGYDTPVGERGKNLSQGQRQLIAIARALLADPRILIMDEATSSVDTRTEQLIQQALTELLKNRTSFVIAHRLSTVRNADLVLVVNDGQIVERGTHRELLERNGLYAELYRRQFRDADLAAAHS